MKVIFENTSIRDFEAWSYAVSTKEEIIRLNKVDEFDNLIDELYPDGVDATQLNDLLWHDTNFVYESLGIDEEE